MAPVNAINVRRVYQFLETTDHGGIIQPPEGAAVARADVATPGDAGTGGGPSAGPTHPRTFPARTLPATGNGANVDTYMQIQFSGRIVYIKQTKLTLFLVIQI